MRRPFKHIDLGDKFSEFEYTPDDSNWNAISGGINPKKQPGALTAKMDDLSVTPSSDVWSGISATLHPKRKKRVAAWWWTGAAASLVFITLLNLGDFSPSELTAYTPRVQEGQMITSIDSDDTDYEEKNSGQLASFTSKENSLENSASVEKAEKLTDLNSFTAVQSQERFNPKLSVENYDHRTKEAAENEVFASNSEEETLIGLGNENKDFIGTTSISVLALKQALLPSLQENLDLGSTRLLAQGKIPFWLNNQAQDDNSDLAWAGSSISALTQLSGSAQTEMGQLSTTVESIPDETFVQDVPGVANISYEYTSEEEFSTPIYINLQFEKQLKTGTKNRISLGSGLGYLRMNSRINFESETVSSITRIRRNYLVVPLYVKYDWVKKQKWNLYTSLGSTGEFSLSGKSETEDFVNGELEEAYESELNLGVGQANAYLSLGANVQVLKKLNFFTEASVARYYYSTHYNFWSTKELWPSLRTGFTYRF